jgi:regulator of extracellular matrix RemA (YlzA/DUF370 family)
MSNKDEDIVSFDVNHRGLNVGHGNLVVISRIVAILEPGSLPMKRLRDSALEKGLLVDATAGRKVRSLIVTNSRHVILSAVTPHALHERMITPPREAQKRWENYAQMEVEEGEFVS